MRYLPKLHQLRVFQEVVRQGSIRSAARALAQSQPAISRTLKALENVLQTSLFHRGPLGITLTPSGELFAVRSRLILAELQRAGDEISLCQQQPGKVTIGMSALPGVMLLPSLLKKLQRQHPPIALTIAEGSLCKLLPALTAGEVDFAVGPLPQGFSDKRLNTLPIFSAPLCVATGKNHPLHAATQFGLPSGEKWLLLAEDEATSSEPEGELQALFPSPPTILRTASLLFGLKLAQTADYLVLMPKPLLAEFSHALQALNLPVKSARRYGVIWSKHSPLTAAARQALTQFLDICSNNSATLALVPDIYSSFHKRFS